MKTAIHFEKDEDPLIAKEVEDAGGLEGLMTGAFLAIKWIKLV